MLLQSVLMASDVGITIRLPKDLADRLRQQAGAAERSLGAEIRLILKQSVEVAP